MATEMTEHDEGKSVVANGDEVGVVTKVDHGTAYVEPGAGMTDKIKSKLGWGDRNEDTYPLREESIEEVTDSEIRLKSSM